MKIFKIIHRFRRSIFFGCIGSLIGQNILRLPDDLACFFMGLILGMGIGYGIGLIYLIKKGLLK